MSFSRNEIDKLQPNFNQLREHYDYADARELLTNYKNQLQKEEDSMFSWVALFYSALHGLVQLKKHKDENGKGEYYKSQQPLHWNLANFAVGLWAKSDYGAKMPGNVAGIWKTGNPKTTGGTRHYCEVECKNSIARDIKTWYNDHWVLEHDEVRVIKWMDENSVV